MAGTIDYVLKVPFPKRRENHVFSNPENWNAGNAENCDAVYIAIPVEIVEVLTGTDSVRDWEIVI